MTAARSLRILVASGIDPGALSDLERGHDVVNAIGQDEETLAELAHDREAIVFRSGVAISPRLIEAAPQLQLLVRAGSGLDNLALAEARERSVAICRIPGPGARAVAELTFALILNLARPVRRADRLLREGHWPKPELAGRLLQGKTLGVVGVGNIGTVVGTLGASWEMRVLGCVEAYSPQRAADLKLASIELTNLDRVLAESDYVTVHANLKDSTHHLLSGETLAKMKPGACLVNMARGGIVDELALAEAIESGRIAGAALDVHETEGEGTISPLGGLEEVILTPHIGAMALEAQALIGERVLALVNGFASGRLAEVIEPDEMV